MPAKVGLVGWLVGWLDGFWSSFGDEFNFTVRRSRLFVRSFIQSIGGELCQAMKPGVQTEGRSTFTIHHPLIERSLKVECLGSW